MPHLKSKIFFLLFLLCIFYSPARVHAASLLNTTDSLQSSRLSFAGRVKSPTASGGNHVWLYTESLPGFYSISTAGLNGGDLITIGTNTYAVASIVSADEFTLTAPLAAGDASDLTPIYFKAKPQHIITFNTASAIPDGLFRVLLPATSVGSNDTVPDSNGFDFNIVVDTSFVNASGYTFVSKSAVPAGSTGCPQGWHCFDYRYTGTGNYGTPITLIIGNTNGVNTPVAPSPKSSHQEATADTYSFKVQNFSATATPATDVPTDQTIGKIGINESVHVSAIVLGGGATPPSGLLNIITPTSFVPPNVPITTPTPSKIKTTPLNLFYSFLLILLIFGLPLHILMSIVGTQTPLKFILGFIFILAYPFLRRKKYQTVPFCFITIFRSDELGRHWQSTFSDINGHFDLHSHNLPQDILVSLKCNHRTWKDVLIKSSLLSISCLFPNKVAHPTGKDELTQNIFNARTVPLIMACLTSGLAYIIVQNPFVLLYLYFSLQFSFSEYLYPRLLKDKPKTK